MIMFKIYLALFFFMTFINLVSSAPVETTTNGRRGCGPVGLNIDPILRLINEGEITPCCVQHDACYSTCGSTKSMCDQNFQNCLDNACATQSSDPSQCDDIATGLYSAVVAAGEPSYAASQLVRGCTSLSGGD
jgi:hypothetical protein